LTGFFAIGVGGSLWSGNRFENDAKDRWLTAGKTDAANLTDTVLAMISEAESTLRALAGRLEDRTEFDSMAFADLVFETEGWNLNIEFDSIAYAQRILRNQRAAFEQTSGGMLTVIGKPGVKSQDVFESFAVRLTSDETGWFHNNADLTTHPAMSSVVKTAHRIRNQVIMGPAFIGSDGRQHVIMAIAVNFANQQGILAATIDLTQFFADLQTTVIPKGLEVRLIERDNEARAESLFIPVIGSATPPTSAVKTELIRIARGQARWDLNWDIMPDYRGGLETRFAQAVKLGGSILTTLITLLIGFFAFQNIRISRLVDERTNEIRRTLDKVEAAENLLSKAFQSSPALFSISSPVSGAHIEVNDTWSSITGYSHEEAMEKTIAELKIWKNMEDRKHFVEQVRIHGVVRNYETIYLTKNGTPKNMLVSGEFIKGLAQITKLNGS
jgi:PAS domain S-box-containing protein